MNGVLGECQGDRQDSHGRKHLRIQLKQAEGPGRNQQQRAGQCAENDNQQAGFSDQGELPSVRIFMGNGGVLQGHHALPQRPGNREQRCQGEAEPDDPEALRVGDPGQCGEHGQ
ncbi:hypothetical protein [Leisingera aquaemixtae]|uniref:hypothetical protein n=1 Tax=Leisingera aquaemixtae TaxID=1396826 RepID=UPI0021A846B7|nr:hypothetical protein [Leisingera aquaemixtae]UWQ45503.1 hypothetical protein K3719_17305 [Leisingera aquaemixtae]